MLCDTEALRLSAVSDTEHLYVQAVIWGDDDGSLGLTEDGRSIGDWSSLVVDVDADGAETPSVDRSYALNPWPSRPGLHYSVSMGRGSSSGLRGDSKGRGSTSYVETPEDGVVRVECFVIPLEELGLEAGATIRMAYWASSPTPEITVNSVGFERDRAYYAHHLPRELFHAVTVGTGDEPLDVASVPEGRDTIQLEQRAAVAPPEVGSRPPEIAADSWKNWEGQGPTLASLKGKVVVVEFWATWCGPCIAGIPHLNEVQDRYRDDGLVILSLTDQARVGSVARFADETETRYAVGFGSPTSDAYGVTGIPHAFVIGRDGLVRWHGHPADEAFEASIAEAVRGGGESR